MQTFDVFCMSHRSYTTNLNFIFSAIRRSNNAIYCLQSNLPYLIFARDPLRSYFEECHKNKIRILDLYYLRNISFNEIKKKTIVLEVLLVLLFGA